MDNALYLMGSRMNSLKDNLHIIAGNLANANTPGFKRTVSNFKAVWQRVTPPQTGYRGSGAISHDWPVSPGKALDFSQGAIRTTGRPPGNRGPSRPPRNPAARAEL